MRNAQRQAVADQTAKEKRKRSTRAVVAARVLSAIALSAACILGGYQLMMHSDTPLPDAWNPARPLELAHPVTPLTSWKLDRASANADLCLAALDGYAALAAMPPLEHSAQCFIRDRVNLSQVGAAALGPIETRCAIALRTAMWEHHTLQPAAQDLFGTSVARINHMGSYNCRQIRTVNGPSQRFSTHATADAIDVSGFVLSDGWEIDLLADWDGAGAKAAFLRLAKDGACKWFELTLSPDYNRLHADHFHLQSKGWGSCR